MRKVVLFAIFAISSVSLFAQQNLEENEAIRNVFADAEFFFASDDYIDALLEYQRLYKRGFKDNANINYKMGICYLNIAGEKEKAIDYLQAAKPYASKNYRESALREKNAPFDTYLYLGNAFRVTNQLDSAINAYNKYLELTSSDANLKLNHQFAQKQIENCKNAKNFIKSQSDINVTNLGRPVNNNASNFRAVISGDESSMVYMNALPFYDALYYSTRKSDGSWSTPTNITPQVQSDGDQYATGISYDGKILLLSREDAFDSDIYISYFEDGQWTKSSPIGTEINTKYWESHASLSKDGNTLYFASNRQGSKGEMDIYESVKDSEGRWGPPVLLGSNINSSLNEDTPFLTSDGSRLYFSSQGHTNIGGYDIFYVDKMADGSWSKPVNLGYPINSTDDDLFYVPISNTTGYMAKLDDAGYGREDIYKYSTLSEETVAYQENEEEIVPDEETESIEEAAQTVVQAIEETHEIAEQIIEEPETVVAQPEQEVSEEVATEEEKVTEKEVVVPAEKIEISVEPILFGFDSYEISEKEKNKLNGVIDLLNKEKNISITIFAYTDAVGGENYNMALSKMRAKSIAKFISITGINSDRIKIEAKGATDFIAINKNSDGSDNPRGRKYNRRAEIQFYNTSDNISITQKNIVPNELRIK